MEKTGPLLMHIFCYKDKWILDNIKGPVIMANRESWLSEHRFGWYGT